MDRSTRTRAASHAVRRAARSPEWWLFTFGLVGAGAVGVWMACAGPGPAGYNVITGQGAGPMQPGSFGPTRENISAGLSAGVVLGGVVAGLARAVRWVIGRRP